MSQYYYYLYWPFITVYQYFMHYFPHHFSNCFIYYYCLYWVTCSYIALDCLFLLQRYLLTVRFFFQAMTENCDFTYSLHIFFRHLYLSENPFNLFYIYFKFHIVNIRKNNSFISVQYHKYG